MLVEMNIFTLRCLSFLSILSVLCFARAEEVKDDQIRSQVNKQSLTDIILRQSPANLCEDILGKYKFRNGATLNTRELFEFVTVVKRIKNDNAKSKAVIAARKRCKLVTRTPIFPNSVQGLQQFVEQCQRLRPQIERYRKNETLLDQAKTRNEKAVAAAVRLGFAMMQPPFCGACPCLTDQNDECVQIIGKEQKSTICRFKSSTGLVAVGDSPDFTVMLCKANTLFIQISSLSSFSVGDVIWKIPKKRNQLCSQCNYVARKIVGFRQATKYSGRVCPKKATCAVVQTNLAKFSDLFSSDALKQLGLVSFKNRAIEPMFKCNSPTARQLLLRQAATRASALKVPTSCRQWQNTQGADRRCVYTDCIVGSKGNPFNCFYCKNECVQFGCGSVDFDAPDDIPLVFDFNEACCSHDHCYASSFGKAECDFAFLRDLLSSCLDEPSDILYRIPLPLGPLTKASAHRCEIVAMVYYLAVRLRGKNAYERAQNSRREYENTAACAAKCPTRQKSGGRGTHSFLINLLKKKGTFRVSYEMYRIPDKLEIYYEGRLLFSTPGLVSGNKAFDVKYVGKKTFIKVVVSAPQQGTEWRFSVGCP